MKLNYYLILFNSIVAYLAQAQNHSIYFSNGILYPSIYSNSFYGFSEHIDSSDQVATYFLELGYKYRFNKNIGFRTGLAFEKRGWIEEIFVIHTLTGELRTESDAYFSYSFITLPILFDVRTGKKLTIFGNVGMNAGLRVAGCVDNLRDSEIPLSHFYPDYLNPKLDLGWTMNAGIEYLLNDRNSFFAEGGYYLGLSKIGTKAPIENEIRHKWSRIGIGFLLYLL